MDYIPPWACSQWGQYEHDWMDCPECCEAYESSQQAEECPCFVDPLKSRCGKWEGNQSACTCAEHGVIRETGQPLPS